MNQDKSREFRTSSLALSAAILATTPIKLIQIEWNIGSKATFVFAKHETELLDKTVTSFWNKSLLCDCSTYFETLKFCKSRLYEEGRR